MVLSMDGLMSEWAFSKWGLLEEAGHREHTFEGHILLLNTPAPLFTSWLTGVSSFDPPSPFHHRPRNNEATSGTMGHSDSSSALFLTGILSQFQKAEGQSHTNTPSRGSRDPCNTVQSPFPPWPPPQTQSSF